MAELLAAEPSAEFQSTHPVRGATYIDGVIAGWNQISIHAPREGCDGRLGTV